MISDSENCTYNNTIVNFVGGTCSSYNITIMSLFVNFVNFVIRDMWVDQQDHLYKTTGVGEHRRSFHKLSDNKDCDLNSDEFALGHHLFSEHQLKNRNDFDLSYNVSLLDFCSPSILDVKERKFIHLQYLIP